MNDDKSQNIDIKNQATVDEVTIDIELPDELLAMLSEDLTEAERNALIAKSLEDYVSSMDFLLK